jgi:hypothetical protein
MEKEILRSQYDGKKSKWRIAKKTNVGAGGWKSFGSGAIYDTQQTAESKIDFLIESSPEMYKRE